ncbi:MAG: glycosyltransferase family 2 protein [Salinispira sp.]
MKHDLISVIIPFYNRANYLPEAVDSVFRQTTGNVELILVDDGSTDASMERACRRWKNRGGTMGSAIDNAMGSAANQNTNFSHHSPIRTLINLRIPHSGMPGLVRNRGIELSSGSLIAFLDSDDLWLPRKLELQLPLHKKFRISHTRETWLRAESAAPAPSTESAAPASTPVSKLQFRTISQKSQKHRRSGNIFQDALWKCIIGPSTVLMEKTLFAECGMFREDLEIAEDYEFWLRICSQTDIAYVDAELTQKRAGMPDQNQLSERCTYIEQFRIQALRKLLETSNCLHSRQRYSAWSILRKKAEIVRNGAEKRGQAGDEYTKLIQQCDTEMLNVSESAH